MTDRRPTNDRPTSHFCKFRMAISRQRIIRYRPIHLTFGSRVGFSMSADRMALFPVGANPRLRLAFVLEIFEWPYFCNGSCDSLRVWFYDRVFGSADRMSLLPVGPNRRSWPLAVLYNFGHISETVHPIQFVCIWF